MNVNGEDKRDFSPNGDETLMIHYMNGDIDAFQILYNRYSGKTYGFIKNRIHDATLADDTFQIVWTKLHQLRHRYNSEFPFRTWLFVICRTSVIDSLRKIKPVREYNDEFTSPEWDNTTISDDFKISLEDDTLPINTQERTALQMRYLTDLPFEAIANEMNTSAVNIRKIISRAIAKLRVFYRREGAQ